MAKHKSSRDTLQVSRDTDTKFNDPSFRHECVLPSFSDESDFVRFFQRFTFAIRKIERRTLSKFEYDQASGKLFLNSEDTLRARIALDSLQLLLYAKKQNHSSKRAPKKFSEGKKKVYNLQENLEVNKNKREKALLKKLYQELDLSLAFPCEGSFLIPFDDFDVYEYFGGESLVFLNAIRIRFRCYIDYSPNLSLIHIRCQNPSSLKQALHHVKLFYFEQASYHRLKRSHLNLHVLDLNHTCSNLKIFYDREFVLSRKFLPNRIHLRGIPSLSSSSAESLEKIRNDNVQTIKNYTLASIFNVYLYIGVIFMRVKVGVPLFERLKIGENETNTNSIQDASKILLEKQTKSSFLRYLAPNDVSERILSSLESIKDINGKQVFEAFGTDPLIVAHFTLTDIHNSKKILTAVWDKPVGRPNIWYVESSMKDTLSIVHCNLNSLSWNLSIKYGEHFNDSKAYGSFASSIIMDNKDRIYFLNTAEVFVETVAVKLKNKFYHVPSGYHFHLSRFETHSLGKNTYIDSDTQPGIQVYRIGQDTSLLRYGLSFWDSNWDRIFAENQQRSSGSPPTYKPTLQTFFPEGIEAFIFHSQSIVSQVATLANQLNDNHNIFEADNSVSASIV
ncbi:uncharacterized protein SOCG_02671 [Schizosaccharomyces octosporus yFS286]|uniref:Fungal protein n=1 Tax=Schizosaccharomyces octosporus (strain yFS286) TaxID=483514 RepID=S9PZQ5_SCHOY|nr:uncharacterized protein SOCG_02671 [Schizosaccharomyces octosporus yFS286]EPX73447.1 fungal protein [Schizosaccharomyces octosporus yFS286]